ncbi:Peptidyl-prolyl cis-trans isomerase D [Shimia sp. SK013]|uniref:peptidylprolyl isomerase n=1 Tax=Shimia sp. SK013 TaxID=1389006 RepID=UPI0006B564CE|nr:peptidylprolyl isomerase [Shimia sp. SK013]KPA22361.1 Peptidyl-prolyl cis-trans isomerase D [Shimia sp. SK013]
MATEKPKGKTSKTLVWILMAMLILGLGGFGVTNLSGTIRSVGTVGGKDISVDDYARGLQEEMNAYQAQIGQPLTFAQAQMFGVDRNVLARLVTTRSLDAETSRLGLSIGDENLRRELLAIPAFQGINGDFDRDAYAFAIDQAGMSESVFEDSVREETARSLLQGAIVSGINIPNSYAATVIDFVAEDRDFTWTKLTADNLTTPVEDPSEADVRAYYDANIDSYMLPATRQITFAWVTPAMLLDTVDVDEAALKALYEERDAEFNQPERRLVERLAFADAEAAETALGKLRTGETSFEALVESRGLALSDVDLGDVSKAELSTAGEAVFLTPVGGIAGPVATDLGPALFRVNGILPARFTSFEDAVTELRKDLAIDRARRVIDLQVDVADDLLAGGATLEELADETDMMIGTIDWHNNTSDDIAGYEGFRAAATAAAEGDFPEIVSLEDGGMFALRLEGETESTPAPFAEVKDDASAALKATHVAEALGALVNTLEPQLKSGTHFTSFGFNANEETDMDRSDFVAGTPADFMSQVFEMTVGELRQIPAGDGGLLLVRLDAIAAPDYSNPEISGLINLINQQLSGGISQDLFQVYAEALQVAYPAEINTQAINAVHAQMQ